MKIEKNIPIPTKASAGRKSMFPWEDMQVGDSFFVSEHKSPPSAPSRVRKEGMKFTSRSVDGGFRVWRTE